MANYTVELQNEGFTDANFCIFQVPNGSERPNAFPLAWMTQDLPPEAPGAMHWSSGEMMAYLSETGHLTPGVEVYPMMQLPANYDTENSFELQGSGGAFHLGPMKAGPKGQIQIMSVNTIPMNVVTVGYGFSERPVYAEQAQPNMMAIFPQNVKTFITVAQNVRPGEVLNAQALQVKAELPFLTEGGPTACKVVLNEANELIVTQI